MIDVREIEARHPLPWSVEPESGHLVDRTGHIVGMSLTEENALEAAWSSQTGIIRRLAHAAGFTEDPDTPIDSINDLVEHIEQTRAIAREASDNDRLHDTERVAVLNTITLLGLVPEHVASPDRMAAAHALYWWAQARAAERDRSMTAAKIAETFGVPREVTEIDRTAADRLTAAIVAELLAQGWKRPGE